MQSPALIPPNFHLRNCSPFYVLFRHNTCSINCFTWSIMGMRWRNQTLKISIMEKIISTNRCAVTLPLWKLRSCFNARKIDSACWSNSPCGHQTKTKWSLLIGSQRSVEMDYCWQVLNPCPQATGIDDISHGNIFSTILWPHAHPMRLSNCCMGVFSQALN